MLRGSVALSWLAATVSAQERPWAPHAGDSMEPQPVPQDTAELADLQMQLQQALDQQAQLNTQQEALTSALTPLLSWANHMAPHNTGCDLDHYTSILTLCGADASAYASATEPTVEPGVNLVTHTDASCECMESWHYKGQRYAGCQVTDQPPEMLFFHAPWCVVASGCEGAHPGPWGAWDYCKVTTNWTKTQHGIDDAGRRQWFQNHGPANDHAPLDSWVMEPQALFTSTHFHIESPVSTYCSDET